MEVISAQKIPWLAPVLLVAAFYSFTLFRFAAKQFGGNVTGFSYISEHYPAPQIWNEKTLVRKDDGYDGMFYYYIAHDPFLRTDLYKNFLDGFTAYRYQRVAYPLTVFAVSLGKKEWIPYGMVIVNIFAVALGTFFMAKIAGHYGMNAWFALLYGLLPGLFIAVTRNLTEPLQVACLCGGAYFYVCRGSLGLSALFLTLAALSKDTALLVPFGFGAYDFFKERNWKRVLPFLLPFLFYFGWQAYVTSRIGETYLPHGDFKNFGGYNSLYPVPFVPMIRIFWDKIQHMEAFHFASNTTVDLSFLFFCAFAMLLSVRGFKNRSDAMSVPLILFGILTAFIANPWIEFYGYGRNTAPLFAFLIAHFLATGDRAALVPVAGNLFTLFLFLRCANVLP